MNRVEKKETVDSIKEILADTSSLVVMHYRGLTVAEVTNLRKDARAQGVSVKVSKNSLTKLAIGNTKFSGIANLLSGPTAIAYSKDPVAAAKTVEKFAKKNEKLVILGGALNESVLDANGVLALAKMPSLDESRAKLIALINTPASRIVGVLSAPGGQVARVLSAKASKGA